jgi:predicted transcriptional regulator
MKKVFTISLEEATISRIKQIAEHESFRSKSHCVEIAILQFLEKYNE